MNQKLLFIRKYNCTKSQKQNRGIIIKEKSDVFQSVRAVRTLRKARNHQTMEAKKPNIMRKEEEETKTAVNDQRNFAARLKELVSEDR